MFLLLWHHYVKVVNVSVHLRTNLETFARLCTSCSATLTPPPKIAFSWPCWSSWRTSASTRPTATQSGSEFVSVPPSCFRLSQCGWPRLCSLMSDVWSSSVLDTQHWCCPSSRNFWALTRILTPLNQTWTTLPVSCTSDMTAHSWDLNKHNLSKVSISWSFKSVVFLCIWRVYSVAVRFSWVVFV